MKLLVVTNLYPPQELGGYGRSIADFVWGLQERGHQVQVLCSDAGYLGPGGNGPSGELVDRCLMLKGDYHQGVRVLDDPIALADVDRVNAHLLNDWLDQGVWDGILVGNLDLLGFELLNQLLGPGLPVLQHLGFVNAPFAPEQLPKQSHYRLVSASQAVRSNLVAAGFPVATAPVVYPGARVELMGLQATGRRLPPAPGPYGRGALRVCFAGLLMENKGPHTLLEAVAQLHHQGVAIEAMVAGGRFSAAYAMQLEQYAADQGIANDVQFVKQLSRDQLARFFRLNHVAVFPSVAPEAFGIVAAEAMASGLALVSSAVGGAAELFEPEVSGLAFRPGDAADLARQLLRLTREPGLLARLQAAGEARVRQQFSVAQSALELEQLFGEIKVQMLL
jgi:glycosyltransferase involved in cell wall biosynthesis